MGVSPSSAEVTVDLGIYVCAVHFHEVDECLDNGKKLFPLCIENIVKTLSKIAFLPFISLTYSFPMHSFFNP